MYYFDDNTGSYKKYQYNYQKLFTLTLGAFVSVFTFFLLYTTKLKEGEINKLKTLYQENQELINSLEVINNELVKNRELLNRIKRNDEVIYRSLLLPDNLQNQEYKLRQISNNQYNIEIKSNHEDIVKLKNHLEEFNLELLKQEYVFENLQQASIRRKNILNIIPAIIPVSNGYLASGFGMRLHPIYRIQRFHKGWDIASRLNTPIMATGDATVQKVGEDKTHGIYILLNHGFGYHTFYAHLNATKVSKGQKVKRGQVIGLMGNTGLSTGPHVHYEIRENGKAVNPINYIATDISPEEYKEIMKINNTKTVSLD